MNKTCILIFSIFISAVVKGQAPDTWIRINQLGYTPNGLKVAVWCKKGDTIALKEFSLVDAVTQKTVFKAKPGKNFGAYGPFHQTFRLDFSVFKKPGRYYLQTGKTRSPEFAISKDVYKGTADFCLRYMRQQRTGFNPFFKDSCHTHDGYTLYGSNNGLPDSTRIDVVGGWHDASDYLQYVTTSANATYHLLLAYRDFPNVFTDEKQANGLDGKNGMADVLDEAKWGLDWLMKMHPSDNRMFNQIADDRDHISMRIPKLDSQYGRGYERPVYFINGEPQQRGKFMNNTTGTSSTAGKVSAAFALANYLKMTDPVFNSAAKSDNYYQKAMSAFQYGKKKPGVTQTASVRSPYIYAEENWVDDMELASISIHNMLSTGKDQTGAHGWYIAQAADFAKREPVTPWLGGDTAKHYQWYPFINLGHGELIRQLKKKQNGPQPGSGYYREFVDKFWNNEDTITGFYKKGIELVWNKAAKNAFYRGIPFIWCSNNLTVAFAMQCYWYRELTGEKQFAALEQANIDWLFGCNPWGTSMIYGLPSWGDSPVDPHSAFTHIKKYPIDGGLVDGPVYTSIYKSLIGIKLYEPDEYEDFQSDLAVYHDDYGDYSTNEPTMDGTASLIYLLAARENEDRTPGRKAGTAITRGDTTQRKLAIVFTGDEFAEGGDQISQALKNSKSKASFFFTGRFYRNASFQSLITQLKRDGHYLGAHSDQHLLYCDWNKRDSLLVTKKQFRDDLLKNYTELKKFGVAKEKALYFLPPYEWFNDSIVAWTNELGLQLINYTPGTRSAADYTWPELKNYQTTEMIYESIRKYHSERPSGLNGFLLLLHIGTDPRRTDKFYSKLPDLLNYLGSEGYQMVRVDELLK